MVPSRMPACCCRTYWRSGLHSSSLLHVRDRALQNLIPPPPDAFYRRPDLDIGEQPDPLQLLAVRPSHIVSTEIDANPARSKEKSDIPIRARCRAPYKNRSICRAIKKPTVFGLADGALIDQHHRLASIARLINYRNTLLEQKAGYVVTQRRRPVRMTSTRVPSAGPKPPTRC